MLLDRASLERGTFQSVIVKPNAPLQLEVGIDTGVTLCRLAATMPAELFVGVEIKPHQAKVAHSRARGLALDNVIIVNDEAAYFVSNHCPSSTFSTVHIYFPTPQLSILQKIDRSLAHLLLVRRFVDELHRVMIPGGALRIATDVDEYYRATERLFNYNLWTRVNWSELNINKPKGYFVGSPCERAYRQLGRQIFAVELLRI